MTLRTIAICAMTFSKMTINQIKFCRRQQQNDIQKNGIQENDNEENDIQERDVKENGIRENGIWENIWQNDTQHYVIEHNDTSK